MNDIVKEKDTIVAKSINLTIIRAKLKSTEELPPLPYMNYLLYNADTNLPVLSSTDFTCEQNINFFLSNYPSFFPLASEYFNYISLPLGKVYVTFTYPSMKSLDSCKDFFSKFRIYSKDIATLKIEDGKFPSSEYTKNLLHSLKNNPKIHSWIKCYQNQTLYSNHIESYIEYCKEEAMEEEEEEQLVSEEEQLVAEEEEEEEQLVAEEEQLVAEEEQLVEEEELS
jgi:hypothetical protein